MELPLKLRTALDNEFESLPAKKLAKTAAGLSERYRGDSNGKGERLIRADDDVSAYAAFRMPATYAAVFASLSQLKAMLPEFAPQTLLDVGAGPGTVMWAVNELWPDIDRITLLEREPGMMAAGRRIAAFSDSSSVRDAEWVHTDISNLAEFPSNDLIVASYSLGELSPDTFEKIIHKLWNAAAKALVIIEPGTTAGFQRIRQARDILTGLGGHIIAPCPHNGQCMLKSPDWCHFSQRISRSRMHRQIKQGGLAYEDEKFSYIAVSRTLPAELYSRVLRHPQIRKGHIQLELCTPEGLETKVVTQKDKELYRTAKNAGWGSTFLK